MLVHPPNTSSSLSPKHLKTSNCRHPLDQTCNLQASIDMATLRTYSRDVSRPTAIDEMGDYETRHSRSKHQSRRKHRSRPQESPPAARAVATHPKKISDPIADRDNAPSLELDFMHGLEDRIAFGKSVRVDVLVSLRYPQQQPSVHPLHLDYSRLIAITTIVAEDQDGNRIPMDASTLAGQKTCDTVHSIQQAEKQLLHHFPDRLAMGYSSFPDLRIGRPGTYRIRVTMMRTGGSADEGAVNVACIDSNLITVLPPVTRRR